MYLYTHIHMFIYIYTHTYPFTKKDRPRQRQTEDRRGREEYEDLLRQHVIIIRAQYQKQFFKLGKLLGDFL